MGKPLQNNITAEDVLDYTEAVQAMYGVAITIELSVAPRGVKAAWCVNAVAWTPTASQKLESITHRMITYPTAHHKTFMGACLGAVMTLEQALQAWYWLQQMDAAA